MKKLRVHRVLSLDKKTVCVSDEQTKALLTTLQDGEFVTVEFKLEAPNEEATDKMSLTSRLRGHEKAIEVKEVRTLLLWANATKASFMKDFFSIGEEIKGYTLRESYIPITALNETFGLDASGNVVEEPQINPSTNEILLYSWMGKNGIEIVPMFRQVALVKGAYIPFTKPEHVSVQAYFSGEKRGANNRKTIEFQEYLNELRVSYMEFENAASEIKDLEFAA